MLDELRRLDRLSRTVRARARSLQTARNALSHSLGRLPEAGEMARARRGRRHLLALAG